MQAVAVVLLLETLEELAVLAAQVVAVQVLL
jgi:hypothetical protein